MIKTISGLIKQGEQVGRTIGFPTANLDVTISTDDLEPGVYLAHCTIENQEKEYYGLAYFGPRHIFNELHNVFEVFLYDFSGDLYGQHLTVELLHKMRPPEKIASLKELQLLLENDKKQGQKRINAL